MRASRKTTASGDALVCTDEFIGFFRGFDSPCSHMKKKDTRKVDGYTMGELSQLARRRMIQQVRKNKKKYNRKNKHKDNG